MKVKTSILEAKEMINQLETAHMERQKHTNHTINQVQILILKHQQVTNQEKIMEQVLSLQVKNREPLIQDLLMIQGPMEGMENRILMILITALV
jgi:hypothetical protein